MVKSIEIQHNKVINIAVGDVENWVQVADNVSVHIGDTATQAGSTWTFAPPKRVDGRTYRDKRRDAYADMGDQLDSIWHAMDTGASPKIEPWYSQIKAVKIQYPKG